MGEKSSKVLETNIDQFNSSLEDWTGLVKGQITELSRSFEALRGFGDSMPTLLDSMQSGNNSDNGFRLAPHNMLALSQLAMLSPHLEDCQSGARGSPRVCQKVIRPGGDELALSIKISSPRVHETERSSGFCSEKIG